MAKDRSEVEAAEGREREGIHAIQERKRVRRESRRHRPLRTRKSPELCRKIKASLKKITVKTPTPRRAIAAYIDWKINHIRIKGYPGGEYMIKALEEILPQVVKWE